MRQEIDEVALYNRIVQESFDEIEDMEDDKFVKFLLTDRYGNNNLDKDSVIHLLSLIGGSSDKRLQNKEFLILKTLAQWN
jgi:hypothetical protein